MFILLKMTMTFLESVHQVIRCEINIVVKITSLAEYKSHEL